MDIRVSQPFILALALNNYDPFLRRKKMVPKIWTNRYTCRFSII